MPVGAAATVVAHAVVDDGRSQAVAVSLRGVPPAVAGLPAAPHVTVSVAEGVRNQEAGAAVAAARALEGGLVPLLPPLELTGTVGLALESGERVMVGSSGGGGAGDAGDADADADGALLPPLALAWLDAASRHPSASPLPPRARKGPPPPPPTSRARRSAVAGDSVLVADAMRWCADADARADALVKVWVQAGGGGAGAALDAAAPPPPDSPQPRGDRRPPSRNEAAWALAGVPPPPASPHAPPPRPPSPHAAARAVVGAAAAARSRADALRAEASALKVVRARLAAAVDAATAGGDADTARVLAAREWHAGQRAADALWGATAAASEGHNACFVNRWWLDLHGTRVAHALPLLARQARALASLAVGPTVLHVVTGYGRNSPAGVGRLLPAVLSWLASSGWAHREDETNPGLVHVYFGG